MAAADLGLHTSSQVGVYGFQLGSLGSGLGGLLDVPDSWPKLEIRRALRHPGWEQSIITEDHAELVLIDDVFVRLDRDPPLVEFSSISGLTDEMLIHPFLSAPVSIHAHWQGWESFHGGAFEFKGRAWAVLADREGGKSTLLASLVSRGFPILSDDLLVMDDQALFSGPRFVDLRNNGEPISKLPTEKVESTTGRDRWRLRLESVAPVTPLGGFVFLSWAARSHVEPITGVGLFRRVAANRALHLAPADPSNLMRLATLPAWQVSRPRELEVLDDTLDTILNLIEGID